MDKERRIRIYDLHSWAGFAVSLFLFLICFTGMTAVFVEELKSWEDPLMRVTLADEPVDIHAIAVAWIEENAGGDEIEGLDVHFPSVDHPFYEIHLEVHGADDVYQEHELRLDTVAGAPLPISDRGDGLVYWLRYFHHNLLWPMQLGGPTIGGLLTGIAGLALLLITVSGLVTHTKFLKQIFTARLNRSVRLKWQDSHNVIGLWGIPFCLMIAFTGAFLGFTPNTYDQVVSGLLDAPAFSEEAPANDIGPTAPQTDVHGMSIYTIDDVYHHPHQEGARHPQFLSIAGWGTPELIYRVGYAEFERRLDYDGYIHLDGRTGAQIAVDTFLGSGAERTISVNKDIHFGTFGGVAIKFLYVSLGGLICILIALGNMMWVERRLHGNAGSHAPSLYRTLSTLNVGIALGLPLATAAIFYTDKLYWGDEASRLAATGWIYFACVVGTLVYAFVRGNDYRATAELLGAAGLAFAFVPALNWAATGDLFLFDLMSPTLTYAWVDMTLLALGVAMIMGSVSLPRKRSNSVRRNREIQAN